jgi:hypothetical protein
VSVVVALLLVTVIGFGMRDAFVAYTPRPWIAESRASTSGEFAGDTVRFLGKGRRALRTDFFCEPRVGLADERGWLRD